MENFDDLDLCTCAECNTDIDCEAISNRCPTWQEYDKEVRKCRDQISGLKGLIVGED